MLVAVIGIMGMMFKRAEALLDMEGETEVPWQCTLAEKFHVDEFLGRVGDEDNGKS